MKIYDPVYPYRVTFDACSPTAMVPLVKWCRNNCRRKYLYQYTEFVFHFEDSRDAILFKLQAL